MKTKWSQELLRCTLKKLQETVMRDLVKRLRAEAFGTVHACDEELFTQAADHIERLEAGEKAADAAITKYQRDLEIQKAANEGFNKRINRMINLIEKHGTG